MKAQAHEDINQLEMEVAENMSRLWFATMRHWNKNQMNGMQDWSRNTEALHASSFFGFFPYKSALQSMLRLTRIGIDNQFAFLDLVKESFSMETFEKMYPHVSEEWYRELTQMQSNFSPLLKVFNGERIAKYNRRLTNKQIELMRLVCSTGISAMENYGEAVEEEQEKVKTSEDLYKAWSAANEKAFEKLFHSERYIKLQEELKEIQMEFKNMFSRPFSDGVHSKMAHSADGDGRENRKAPKEHAEAPVEKREKKRERSAEAAH